MILEEVTHQAPELLRRRPDLLVVVLGIAVAGVVAAVGALLLGGGGAAKVATKNGVPVLVSQAQLERVAASVDHPVYWAGPRRRFRYELTTAAPGRIFVRYLPSGVTAGDPRPDFLTVCTYPGARSFADLKRAANRQGVLPVELDHGGLVVSAARHSHSAYLGYEGEPYQVEVYAPSNGTARNLVLAGRVIPVR